MKKFTLFATAALFMVAASVKADTKIIYQQTFQDANTALDAWQTSRAASVVQIVQTSEANYIQFGDGAANYNGTAHWSEWGDVYGDELDTGEDYTMTFSFCFKQFGNNSSNAAQRNNEIAVWNVPASAITPTNYWGTTTDFLTDSARVADNPGLDYLFKITQALGEGGVATAVGGTCCFYINDAADSVNVAAGNWYVVTLQVSGQTVNYDIKNYGEESTLWSGSRVLAEGNDNRAGGIVLYQARYLGITQLMNIKVSHEIEGSVAEKPTVILSAVKGNDREYTISCLDNENLHYIVPGGEEQEINYYDAYNEETGTFGSVVVTCTQSGELKAWTTKEDATSEVVTVDVECGIITLPEPAAVIASVEEGFGKTYTVSVDNASVLLSPAVALSWKIDYTDGTSESGSYSGASTSLALTKAGTAVITVTSIPVEGVYYYGSNSYTLVNDVEYQIALDVEYLDWTGEQLAANPAFEKVDWTDTNASHWSGKWMNATTTEEKDEAGNPIGTWWKAPSQIFATIEEANAYIQVYNLINDADGVNYNKELLPLIPNTARANVAILVEEGIFVNGTSYNNLEVTFDPQWITDNEAKPNFIEIKRTNNYDRYDKQEGCHFTDIVKTDVTTYTLYRYDTAIHSARVFTYKGFEPGQGIRAIENDITAPEDAAIYNIRGQRVENITAPGIYIQRGHKFIVK
ncbi:MAG: hypothetical protein J6Y05_07315 [Bacteroidales bacterium]|nr:hypothetical protein [Bacteroidales bacterium]